MGASGLAREVYDLAQICYGQNPDFRIKGFLSDGPSNIEEMGYPPVLGKIMDYQVCSGDVFFCAIGKVQDKRKTINYILSQGGEFINLIHPTTIISPSAKIGDGVAIKAFCVISNHVVIGNHTYLQSSVIAGHDVSIGKFCQINSFAFFAGCVKIEDSVTINAGAKLIQNTLVEEGATVGMGSVVLNRVRRGTTVFGNPAKRISI